jgi:glycopeptide antibiotics resistance protein
MRVSLLLFVAYVLLLFKLLFFKVRLNFSDISIGRNFIPFYRIYYYASGQEPYQVGALNLFGNILLFVPMGFFLPAFFKCIRSAKRLLLTVAFISFCIEVLQLLTTTGEFDIDDVLLNTLGALVGYRLFAKNKKSLSGAPPSRITKKYERKNRNSY